MREASASTTTYLKDYQPPRFAVETIDLTYQIHEDHTRVTARGRFVRQGGPGPLELDGQDMELLSLAIDGTPLDADRFQVEEERLVIAEVPDAFTLECVTRIDPAANTSLEGLFVSNGMYCTQCEAEGFRKMTYYPDRPDVMARFTTRIEADKAAYPVLLSNGNCIESGDLGDGRHFATWEDPFLKPAYLFALVAGDLEYVQDSHTTPSGRVVDLRIYVEKADLDKCDHAMASLKNAMEWDERVYGREYDLDIYMIVAVSHFNMGAMENKGLNIFNSKYVLARPDTATDRDFQGVEGVIAHEYFHNWTGNRITCRDWFQLSLKEGFTVFRDQEFSADMGSRGVKRIDDVRILRAAQFPEDAGPMAHPVRPDAYMEINNFYTVTIYNKGAEVVRMQHGLLGAEGFRKATDLYFERHDGQAVTCDDFVTCMEDASGRDLGQFRRWYSQAGTPLVAVTSRRDGDVYELSFEQSCPATPGQPDKEPFHIPFALGLVGPDGADVPVVLEGESAAGAATTRVLDLTEATQTLRFAGVPEGSRPSLLRGFSAPVKVRYDHSEADLAFLMAHDSDDFNRWDAAQNLGIKLILGLVADHQAGCPLNVPDSFIDAFRAALLDEDADRDLLAQVLTLPGFAYLGEHMDAIDIDALHAALTAVRRGVLHALGDELHRVYAANAVSGAYSPDPVSIGKRSLRNVCLGYLCAGKDAAGLELALAQFRAADNMTDSLAALAQLAERDEPEARAALEAFQQRWKDDALVMDKWFAIQAGADRPDALAHVRSLMEHPAFSMTNPNKVRSLVGAFAAMNPVHFHAADGSGYAFLADRIIELNGLNPQVAARMASPFTRWRRYTADRRDAMRAQLERIAGIEGLSKDVNELVVKSLADD